MKLSMELLQEKLVSQWGKMDQAKLEALTDKLVGLGAKNEDIVEMVAGLGR